MDKHNQLLDQFNNLEQKNKIDMQQIEKLELNNKLQSNHIYIDFLEI